MSKRLGRGLEALFSDELLQVQDDTQLLEVELDRIDPNADQPRKHFDEAQLIELAQSIAAHGVVQPIVLKPMGQRYMIIAGERRYRAAKIAALDKIPAIIKDLDARDFYEISLIENIQRADLNAVEEAQAMRFLMDEHDLTQEELSTRLGKSRSSIANTLRLLNLPPGVLQYIRLDKLSSGHARAIAGVKSPQAQVKMAEDIINRGWNVRQAEQHIKMYNEPEIPDDKIQAKVKTQLPELYELENMLREMTGLSVKISGDLNSGKIVLEYRSPQALQDLYDLAKSENS